MIFEDTARVTLNDNIFAASYEKKLQLDINSRVIPTPARPARLFAGHRYLATDKLALLAPIPWGAKLSSQGPMRSMATG